MALRDLLLSADAAAAAAAAGRLDAIRADAVAETAPGGLLAFDLIECIAFALGSAAPAPRLAAAALVACLAAAPLYASQLAAARVLPRLADAADRAAGVQAAGEFAAHARALGAVVAHADAASAEVVEALCELGGALAWLLHSYWRVPALEEGAAALFGTFAGIVEADAEGALGVPHEVLQAAAGAVGPPPGRAAAAAAALLEALAVRDDLAPAVASVCLGAAVRALGDDFPPPARAAAAGALYALSSDDSGALPDALVAAGALPALLPLLARTAACGGAAGVANAAGAIMNVAAASDGCRAAVVAAVPLAALVAALPEAVTDGEGPEADAVENLCGAIVNTAGTDAGALDALLSAGFTGRARGLLRAPGALSEVALEGCAVALCRLAARPGARGEVAGLGDVLASMVGAPEERIAKQACAVLSAVLKARAAPDPAAAACSMRLSALGVDAALSRLLTGGAAGTVARATQLLARMSALSAVLVMPTSAPMLPPAAVEAGNASTALLGGAHAAVASRVLDSASGGARGGCAGDGAAVSADAAAATVQARVEVSPDGAVAAMSLGAAITAAVVNDIAALAPTGPLAASMRAPGPAEWAALQAPAIAPADADRGAPLVLQSHVGGGTAPGSALGGGVHVWSAGHALLASPAAVVTSTAHLPDVLPAGPADVLMKQLVVVPAVVPAVPSSVASASGACVV